MSFAKDVKDEISKQKAEPCCNKAELSALLWINSEISLSSDGIKLEYLTINPTISRRLVTLLKGLYDCEIELLTKERERLNRSCLYIIRVTSGADLIIKDNGLLDYNGVRHQHILNDCCKRSYMRGAFLACGSLNDPVKSYHLEMACNDEREIVFLQKLMNENELNAKITRRRNNLIVYLKEASKIADFLNLIGCSRNYFNYNDTMIKRDISNSINRVINCEVANAQKTLASSKQQTFEIEFLIDLLGKDKIDGKMLEVMQLRLDNPDSSLNELVSIAQNNNLSLTKSGLNHRYRKIHEKYLAIKESIEDQKND